MLHNRAGARRLKRGLVARWIAPSLAAAAICVTLAASANPTFAQTVAIAAPAAGAPGAGASDVNDTTVGVITGGVTGTYAQFGSDLSTVLDSPGKLRVLAILGKGSLQNVEDILKVRGVDVGIVQSDVLTYIKRQGLFPGVENRLQYITKLYNEEFHLLAAADIGKIEDLRGRKVNFGLKGSGIAITSSIVFDLMKIGVEPTYDDPAVALDKLKRGEIAASAGVYGKPAKVYDGLKPTDNIKLLPVPANMELSKVYFPSAFSSTDYPSLIKSDEMVETVAVGAIMVVFGWEPSSWRYAKVARFVDTLFTNLESLQKPPRHAKWQEVNLSAKVPGWIRFPAADDWLKRSAAAAASTAPLKPAQAELAASFQRFLAESPSTQGGNLADPETRENLFQAFEAWRRKKGER